GLQIASEPAETLVSGNQVHSSSTSSSILRLISHPKGKATSKTVPPLKQVVHIALKQQTSLILKSN
ncbi:hypothetical protein BGZ99_006722, partial [Dissophora globulifera]